jgi:hypothetical protein
MTSARQADADAAIRELLLAAIKPDSSVFTDHVAHLCQAYSLLGGMQSATGRDADLRDNLYRALAACARRAMPGTRKPPGQNEEREIPAESLRDLCDGALRLMGS